MKPTNGNADSYVVFKVASIPPPSYQRRLQQILRKSGNKPVHCCEVQKGKCFNIKLS